MALLVGTFTLLGVEVGTEEQCEQQAVELLENWQSAEGRKTLETRKDEISKWADAYPNNTAIRYAAGLAFFAADEPSKATSHLKVAYDASGDAQVGFLYSLALKIDRKPLESIKVLRDLVARYPQAPQLSIALATALIEVQEYDEAYRILEPARRPGTPRPNGDYAAILLNLGTCELFMGKHDAAIATLRDADTYLPNAALIINRLAEAYFKRGDLRNSEAEFQRALKINDKIPSTLFHLGLITEDRDAQKAAAYFSEALHEGEKRMKINSDNGSDHYLLFLICEKLGQKEKAAQYKETAKSLGFTKPAPDKQG
jgi:tetratricopeptide (TPR) repeat protein